jgi:DNA-binding response OmpR family regulator
MISSRSQTFKRTGLRGLELVRAHVANLRKALGAARAIIETVPGLGYRARPGTRGRYADAAVVRSGRG